MSEGPDHLEAPATPKKRKIIHEQAREIVWNVYNYFKQRKHQGDVLTIVSEATGISRASVSRIVVEGRASTSFTTPKPGMSKPCLKSTVDNCGEEAIRRIIHNFSVTNKQRPTINSVYQEVISFPELGFVGKKASFRRLILKMGLRWKKTTDNRKNLMEKSDIRELRNRYIRRIHNYRREGRPIIYTDETYIHASHTTPYEWDDGSAKGVKCPVSKGKRLIIVHAGIEEGFVNNALLIFKSGQKSGDYHDEMNFNNYKQWLETALIPNLPEHSVLVIDNASYHNVLAVKHPVSTTRKLEMVSWLDARSLPFDKSFTKPELYGIIKRNKPTYKEYAIDAILARHGHSVVRLPPYHPELNPIEKVWALAKNRVAVRNVTFKVEDVSRIAAEEFTKVSAEEWYSICTHVKKIEEDYIIKENIMDDFHDELIISVNCDSNTDSVFDYSSDEND